MRNYCKVFISLQSSNKMSLQFGGVFAAAHLRLSSGPVRVQGRQHFPQWRGCQLPPLGSGAEAGGDGKAGGGKGLVVWAKWTAGV